MTLEAWQDITDPTTRKIAYVGDSTTEIGTAEVLRDILYPKWGFGGFGVRHMGKEWAPTGSVVRGTGADAWDIGFQRNGFSPTVGTWKLVGFGQAFTWTKPSKCPTITGFKLLCVDGPSSGNFSYSIDGGAFVDVSTTWAQNNTLKQIQINTPIISTIAIRGANAAAATITTYLVGIEPLCATTGVKVHDISASGAFSNGLIRDETTGAVGDWKQWWLQEQPQLVIMNFINDITLWGSDNPDKFQTRFDNFGSMVTGWGGTIIYYRYFEFGDGSGGGNPTYAVQDDAKARILTVAQKYGGNFYDLDAIYGDHATVMAAGIVGSDATHPTEKGWRMMASHTANLVARDRYAKVGVR